MQTILGANGTIAKVLAKDLTAYTNKIRLVSRNPKKINDTDELFAADLSDGTMVNKAVEGSEIVYLMVGFDYNLKVWRDKWPKIMRATVDACVRNNAKLVFFDNVYLYDIHEIPHMTETSSIYPPSEKGKVRRDIAAMITDAVAAGNLTALIARSADFYGPGNEKSFLIEVVYKNLLKGKKSNWFVNPDKIHSFTYTPDAAKATALLANTPNCYNQVWHLPTDPEKITGRQLASLFANAMNKKDGITAFPRWMIQLIGLFSPFMKEMPEMLYQYDRDYFFDSSKFSSRFPGFKTTGYKEGVDAIIHAA